MRNATGIAFLCSIAVGCSGAAQPDEAQDVRAALELPNGGFTPVDEAPSFGEDALFASIAAEVAASPQSAPTGQSGSGCRGERSFSGRWTVLGDGVGVFRGVMLNRSGAPTREMKGIFGLLPNGGPVLFGKMINRAGQFQGFISGTFTDGAFTGTWRTDMNSANGYPHGDHGTFAGTDSDLRFSAVVTTLCDPGFATPQGALLSD